MSSYIRREKNNFLGLHAVFRWPLGLAFGVGVGLLFWTPIPVNEPIGFLGMLYWGRIFGVMLGSAVTLVVIVVFELIGNETIQLNTTAEVIQIALNEFRNTSRVSVKCLLCKEKLSAERIFSPSEGRNNIQLVCRCGACNSTHPLYSKSH